MKKKIAIVGAGTMGSGIAQVAATAGHEVIVIDAAEAALANGKAGVARSLQTLVDRARISQHDADAILSRIAWSTELSSAQAAGVVIEAIIERLDVKQRLFADLASLLAPDAIFASNTSSLSITAISEGLPDPSRFIGLHFFNPVPVMKLVEVSPGKHTDPSLEDAMTVMMRDWGKHPVTVRDVPGFIVNRVARPFYAEALMAFDEGVDPSAIDSAFKNSGGFRMGPLALADMIGHDINYAAAASVFNSLQPRTRFRPQPAQQRLVEQGLLGRKTGRGVFDYSRDVPDAPDVPSIDAPPANEILVASGDPSFAWLSGTQARDVPAGYARVNGTMMAYGDGRRLAERQDVDVLLDHAFDPAAAPALVATVRDPVALAAVAGLAAAAKKVFVVLPDRPGQLVLRTWCQLANGAADALLDAIATATAIDEAMRYGANFPQGPLEWANGLGIERVKCALGHIAAATGDDLYQPSAGLDLLQS